MCLCVHVYILFIYLSLSLYLSYLSLFSPLSVVSPSVLPPAGGLNCGKHIPVFFTEFSMLWTCGASILNALYVIFLGKNHVSMKKVNVIFTSVALHSIALCVFLCFSASCLHIVHPRWASAHRKLIYISVIHIFPNTVKHELAENGPFNTKKYLRMTNQVWESWVIHLMKATT